MVKVYGWCSCNPNGVLFPIFMVIRVGSVHFGIPYGGLSKSDSRSMSIGGTLAEWCPPKMGTRCSKIRLLWQNNTFELEEIVWCRGGRQVAAQENQRKRNQMDIKWLRPKWAYPKNRIEMLDENGENLSNMMVKLLAPFQKPILPIDFQISSASTCLQWNKFPVPSGVHSPGWCWPHPESTSWLMCWKAPFFSIQR